MMSRSSLALLLAALAAPVACSSEDKPPALGSGASASGAGSTGRSGSGASGEPNGDGAGGVPGSAAAPAGGASDGAPIGEIGGEGAYQGEAGAPPNPSPRCARNAQWHLSPLEGVDTDADERLLAMTPDEQTLVFARNEQLFVLDDGQLSTVALPAGYDQELGVSLTANGLSLIVVGEDGSGFAEVSRANRSGAFDVEPKTARFEALNGVAVTSGARFSSPALSADGETLYFTARMGKTVAYVWRARGPLFTETRRLDPVTLGTEDGQAKLVVSVSADERTLFVFDEALGHVTGLWSATPAAEFTGLVAFEGFQTVVTSAACDRIYGTIETGGSLGVVSGTAR